MGTPGQTLIEVDICQSRVLVGLALSGQDTGIRVDSQVVTGLADVERALGHNRLGEVGGS